METVQEIPKEFKTRDMCLASSLMVDGVRYLRVEKDAEDTRRLIFIFDTEGGRKTEEIERIQSQRANATHVASTVHYDECLRRLKSIIHSV
jgi:hypothetical protein